MGDEISTNVLISGMPGSGKTTLLGRLLERFQDDARGFVTHEVLDENGERASFVLRVLAGQSFSIARLDDGTAKCPVVGRWAVQTSVVDKMGVRAVLNALVDARLVVIDEIARMQLLSPRFQRVVELALDSSVPVIATIHTANHPFTEAVRARSDVYVYEIDQHNRDQKVEPITIRLRRMIDRFCSRDQSVTSQS